MAGMYPDNRTESVFGEELTWPGVDPGTGKFTNGDFSDPLKRPSFIPAETVNLILDNLASLITALGGTPDNHGTDQLRDTVAAAIGIALDQNRDAFTGVVAPADGNAPVRLSRPGGDTADLPVAAGGTDANRRTGLMSGADKQRVDVALRFRGEWTTPAPAPWLVGDVVTFRGRLFACRLANTGTSSPWPNTGVVADRWAPLAVMLDVPVSAEQGGTGRGDGFSQGVISTALGAEPEAGSARFAFENALDFEPGERWRYILHMIHGNAASRHFGQLSFPMERLDERIRYRMTVANTVHPWRELAWLSDARDAGNVNAGILAVAHGGTGSTRPRFRGEWQPGQHFTDEIVTRNGDLYVCHATTSVSGGTAPENNRGSWTFLGRMERARELLGYDSPDNLGMGPSRLRYRDAETVGLPGWRYYLMFQHGGNRPWVGQMALPMNQADGERIRYRHMPDGNSMADWREIAWMSDVNARAPVDSPVFAGTPRIGDNPVAAISISANTFLTNLPVGSHVTVFFMHASDVNNSMTVRIRPTAPQAYTVNSPGHALSGTWRSCGICGAGSFDGQQGFFMLSRRVA